MSLLGTRPFLELTAKYHRRQRIDRLRYISECLRIDQDTGSDEGKEAEEEGRHPFCDATAIMLNSLNLTLTLAVTEAWTGPYRHGGGGGGLDNRGGGGGDSLESFFVQQGVQDCDLRPGTMCCCAGCVSCQPVTPLPPGTSLLMTTSTAGGGGGGAHKSEAIPPILHRLRAVLSLVSRRHQSGGVHRGPARAPLR